MRPQTFQILTIVALSLVDGPKALALNEVNRCGTAHDISRPSILTADIDCESGRNGATVTIVRSARLYLNGFTVRGGYNGINCFHACTIIGPGTIPTRRSGYLPTRTFASST